jgi:muramoyltetrapeptide carboxypeptidase
MPLNFFEDQATESLFILKEFLFKGIYPVIKFSTKSTNKPGYTEGPVVGGNLTMLINSIGTKTHLDTHGKILFLEDVSEKLYRVDRMIVHMKRAGMLEGLKGMIIGHFTSMSRQDTFGFSLQDIISDHIEEFNFPVCFDAPIGHIMPNYPMIIGRKITLNVELGSASFQLK